MRKPLTDKEYLQGMRDAINADLRAGPGVQKNLEKYVAMYGAFADSTIVKAQEKATATMPPMEKEVWVVEDVAAYLQISPFSVRRMAKDGELPATHFKAGWRFKRKAIEDLLPNGM